MSLYKKGTIGSSVWYDAKNGCRTPVRNEKNWSLASLNRSFTETLRFL